MGESLMGMIICDEGHRLKQCYLRSDTERSRRTLQWYPLLLYINSKAKISKTMLSCGADMDRAGILSVVGKRALDAMKALWLHTNWARAGIGGYASALQRIRRDVRTVD